MNSVPDVRVDLGIGRRNEGAVFYVCNFLDEWVSVIVMMKNDLPIECGFIEFAIFLV